MNKLILACLIWIVAVIATACTTSTSTPLTPTPSSLPPSTRIPLEIRVIECPEELILSPTEHYTVAFQVLEMGKPAQEGIMVVILVDDTNSDVNPREATTDNQGQVIVNVLPTKQDKQQQTVVIGAMILPQRIGASCSTEVQLLP